MRPEQAVARPALDVAWQAYADSVDAATASLLRAIDERRVKARANGDLDTGVAYRDMRAALADRGELPNAKELATQVHEATAAYKRAAVTLQRAYESECEALTRDLTLEEAVAEGVKLEWDRVAAQLATAGTKKPRPEGRWFDEADPLIRVVEPGGRFLEIHRPSGATNATGSWRRIGPNYYEAVLENGWTIWFHVLEDGRMQFRNRSPDRTLHPPYQRRHESSPTP